MLLRKHKAILPTDAGEIDALQKRAAKAYETKMQTARDVVMLEVVEDIAGNANGIPVRPDQLELLPGGHDARQNNYYSEGMPPLARNIF